MKGARKFQSDFWGAVVHLGVALGFINYLCRAGFVFFGYICTLVLCAFLCLAVLWTIII